MKISKIITAIVLFCAIYFGIEYAMPKVLPPMLLPSFMEALPVTKLHQLAIFVTGCYLLLSYRKCFSPAEVKHKKLEHYYETFNEEQRNTLDAMSEEDKNRFIEEYEKVISDEKKNSIRSKVFDWEHGYVPKALKPLRMVVMLLLVGSITYTSFGLWKVMEEPIMAYMDDTPVADQTYYNEGLPPVVVNGGGEVKQRDVWGVTQTLERLPQPVRNCISSVIVLSNDNFNAFVGSATPGYTVGITGNADSIYINRLYYYNQFLKTAIRIYVYKTGIANSQTYLDIYNKYYKYNNQNLNSEDLLLDAIRLYIVKGPDFFRHKNKDLHDFLQTALGYSESA